MYLTYLSCLRFRILVAVLILVVAAPKAHSRQPRIFTPTHADRQFTSRYHIKSRSYWDKNLNTESTEIKSNCVINGVFYYCALSLTCLFRGGFLTTGCNALITCCLPQPIYHLSGRRRGRDYRFIPPRRLVHSRAPRYFIHPRKHSFYHTSVFPFSHYNNNQHKHQPNMFDNSFNYQNKKDDLEHVKSHTPITDMIERLKQNSFNSDHEKNPNLHNVEVSKLKKQPDNKTIHSTLMQCGQRYPILRKRIIGGQQASYGELPWQVHIRILGYQCGGVIVRPQFVVTAAHCVHRARLRDIQVHVGEFDTKNTGLYPEPFPTELRYVVEIRVHPQFHYMLTQPDRYDVAVLTLNEPVKYRANILPICLPPPHKDYTSYMALVAGWGKTDNSFAKTGTNVLHVAQVPVITNSECLQWHTRKHIELRLHAEMFCAGHKNGDQDACLGDSGGPLIVNDDGRWTLIGITSAGFGCAIDHQPGIYHKVSASSNWIRENID